MKYIGFKSRVPALFWVFALAFTVFTSSASAEIIEDITLHTDTSGEVDAVIKFSVPIQYVRHFPTRKSPFVSIYFNILNTVPRDEWKDYEAHRSPPSDFIVGFTVSTRDFNTGPKVQIQFDRPVEYDVTAGKSGRSLLIHFKKPDVKRQEKSAAPAAAAAMAALPVSQIPVPAVPVAQPVISVPPVAAVAPSVPVAAVKPVPTPAPAPAQKPAEVAPAVKMTATKPIIIPSKLGAKDGLPTFPTLELPATDALSAVPSETPTLEEQIKIANDKAAIEMAKGQDALLAGQPYAAVEAFNKVLSLPPNKYSLDAQVWIGIARQKSGQPEKARLEYESYLKLYPQGTSTPWVKERLAKLNSILPPPVSKIAAKPAAPAVQPTEFNTMTYGSLSSYYYNGSSKTDSISTVGGVQVPTSLTVNDQSALFSSVMVSMRSYNNEFDNRLVFQDMDLQNFLPNGKSKNRLTAAYADVKNRISNYSVRVGRQSAYGGGVMGRFDGVAAGYGFSQDWRVNVVAGQLADETVGDKPQFTGAGVDFGVRSSFGGSFYYINQTVAGLLDRQAIGGNLRYFEPGRTVFAMADYDTQFQQLNMVTIQGTLNTESGMDYNFLLDQRKSPSLSLRNAVIGTTTSVQTLLDNGWTTDDLIALADKRTPSSSMMMFGFTNHLSERWQLGTDVTLSNTTGLDPSGTQNPDFTVGLEGFVPATPPTGNTWAVSERLIGNDVLTSHDITMFSVSLTKSEEVKGITLLMNNHAFLQGQWTLDSTLRYYLQNDSMGGEVTTISPIARLSYRVKSSLTLEGECGVDWTKNTPNELSSSKTVRQYFALGFRSDF